MCRTRRLTRAPPLDTELHALPLPLELACELELVAGECDCTVTGERPEPGVDEAEEPDADADADADDRALTTATRGDSGVENGATGVTATADCFAASALLAAHAAEAERV